MMDKHFRIILGILGLIGLWLFFSGCGDQSQPPQRPKVIKKKIVIKKTEPAPKIQSLPQIEPAKEAAPPVKSPSPPPKNTTPTTGKQVLAALLNKTGPAEVSAAAAEYDPKGKIDPFLPLFKAQADETSKKKSSRIRRQPLTPLEKIDLSQLKLVSIIKRPSGKLAMVEEASGRGYLVKKGTYMGINSGKVVKIQKDRLQVEEQVENVFGKVTLRIRELKLQKPPGE